MLFLRLGGGAGACTCTATSAREVQRRTHENMFSPIAMGRVNKVIDTICSCVV
nr:MAG TPA: hypothetical protein [Caudoviricetes sp.]